MEKDFEVCLHCASKGKRRVLKPATPHRTPLVSRSDGVSFHLFLEESHERPSAEGQEVELVALYRYDLDPAEIRSESTLVTIQIPENSPLLALRGYQIAADRLAAILSQGKDLLRQYSFSD